MISELSVGVQTNNTEGARINQRAGRQGDTIVSELHGRFYETTFRGNTYSFGISNTALVAANAIATGLTATAQPVIGLYNPINSGVNLIIQQVNIIESTVANSAVSPGGYMYLYSAGNTVTTGSTPINNKTLQAAGSQGKAFAISTALTGLGTSLAVFRSHPHSGVNAAGAATAVSLAQSNTQDNVDGSIIVPPGGVVAVMNQISTTTVNVTTSIMWEESPI